MSTPTLTTPALPAETQRRTRGHRFYPPKAVLRRIPALYATESVPLAEKTLHAKWFTGPFTWYAAELDPVTGEAFGYADNNGQGEWGYFSLPEMEQVQPRSTITRLATLAPGESGITHTGTLRWLVERDCWWSPTPAGQVLSGAVR